MRIAYYMPFKPLGHANPSGDLVIGSELFTHLADRGHHVELMSRLRCRWIYYRPMQLIRLARERRRLRRETSPQAFSIWLSYHSYYKAPDLLGPTVSRSLKIPYTVFQGIYSTKRKKKLKTLPGFLLNRRSLLKADQVFTNKRRDLRNLLRLLPEERVSFIAPGIRPRDFTFSSSWRDRLRREFGFTQTPVVLTAAMMRPGVKAEGVAAVITACARLVAEGVELRLVVVGDGSCRSALQNQGRQALGQRIHFTGKSKREELYRLYSAADIFAFPGVEESLGMVYLEAQSCGLPVVAYRDWGGGEAVVNGTTGLLSPAAEGDLFAANIKKLVEAPQLRRQMGEDAALHIRHRHDLPRNYAKVEEIMERLVREPRKRP